MPLLDVVEIIGVARELRRRAGFVAPPYSAKHLLETCFPDVLVTGGNLPRGVTEIVTLNPAGERTIFYNRRSAPGTQRLGIVHGCAHLIWDLIDETRQRECRMAYEDGTHTAMERRADLFAGEILAPLPDLDAMMGESPLFPQESVDKRHFEDTVDHLASRFNLPQGFIRFRLWDLIHFRKTNYFVR